MRKYPHKRTRNSHLIFTDKEIKMKVNVTFEAEADEINGLLTNLANAFNGIIAAPVAAEEAAPVAAAPVAVPNDGMWYPGGSDAPEDAAPVAEPEEAAAPVAAEPEEVDYDNLISVISTSLRNMAKSGNRDGAKALLTKYHVTALSKLKDIPQEDIINLYNEVCENA